MKFRGALHIDAMSARMAVLHRRAIHETLYKWINSVIVELYYNIILLQYYLLGA